VYVRRTLMGSHLLLILYPANFADFFSFIIYYGYVLCLFRGIDVSLSVARQVMKLGWGKRLFNPLRRTRGSVDV